MLDVLDRLARIQKDVGVFIGKVQIDKQRVRELVNEHKNNKALSLGLAAHILKLKVPTLRRELARSWSLFPPSICRVWKREGAHLFQSL